MSRQRRPFSTLERRSLSSLGPKRDVAPDVAPSVFPLKIARRVGFESTPSSSISMILDGCESAISEMGGKKDQKDPSVAQVLAQELPVVAAHTVEDAIAFALSEASKAHRWDVVAMLAKELEARRLAGSNVVNIADAKRGVK
jgi:hypothetical protein